MAPDGLAELRARAAELSDLRGATGLLHWDQHTTMPPAGAGIRAERLATLEAVQHERLTDPALGRLLDALEPWAAAEDPDGDDVRLLRATRRDHEKAVRVPAALSTELTRAASLGQEAWLAAHRAGDFALFRDALERQIELRHRYVECFPDAEHPYDVLLDDYEPGMRTAEVVPVLAELREGLVPLVEAAAPPGPMPRNAGVLDGPWDVPTQRRAVLDVARAIGFEDAAWRLDPAPHPFAMGMGPGDTRITTRYDEHDFGMALYSALHEFGHGLYESQVDPRHSRTPLGDLVSLGLHESQSRLWENVIGHSQPFCRWLAPQLKASFPSALAGLDADSLYRGINSVEPSLIRIFADETTYNLHIVLRAELEASLMEGALEVDELPAAWNDGMHRLLGVEVPDDAHGVLQDIHWAVGSFGYFPTYTVGNLMAAQLWEALRRDIADVDDRLERGDFAPIREWLRENVHRHGRKYAPRELLGKVTGEPLRVDPFIHYLSGKLADVGAVASGGAPPR